MGIKNPAFNGQAVNCDTSIFKGEKGVYKFFVYEHTVIEDYDMHGIAIYTILMLVCRTERRTGEAATSYGLATYTTYFPDYYRSLPKVLSVLPLGSLPLYAPPEHITELLVDLAQAVQQQYVLYTDTKEGK